MKQANNNQLVIKFNSLNMNMRAMQITESGRNLLCSNSELHHRNDPAAKIWKLYFYECTDICQSNRRTH